MNIFDEKSGYLKDDEGEEIAQSLVCHVNRRSFMKSIGLASTGLVLGVQLFPSLSVAKNGKNNVFSPDVFISVAEDGQVTIISHRSEMGQGIRSSLPLLIADEMEADWNRVTVKQAIADVKYGSQNTDGSRSVRRNYFRLKEAGATARTMLQIAAAQIWKVASSEVTILNHQALLANSDKVLGFGDLVGVGSTLDIPDKKSLVIKTKAQHRYVGKDNMQLLDGQDIVTGKAIFGFDVQLEGMKYSVIARPPVLFGSVESYDATETLKVPGVLQVVELPALTPPAAFNMLGGIAVIAENTWAALQGREKLNIIWKDGKNSVYNTKDYEKEFEKALDKPQHIKRNRGDWQQAQDQAHTSLSHGYYVAGIAHATMEPPAATAVMKGDGVEVWTCTQTPQSAQRNASAVLKIAKEDIANVEINVTLLGGGFGRKSKPDYVAEAVYLAHKTKLPVKVLWTREDEIQHGYYHSPSYQKISAAFDEKGKATGWYHRMVNHPIGATFNPAAKEAGSTDLGQGDMPYDIANIRIANGESDTFLRIGWVRSVTNINNAFAVSSFVDEMADHVGQDSKDYLLGLLGSDRHIDFKADDYKYGNYGETPEDFPVDTARFKRVVELAAEKAEWSKKRPENYGVGIAVHRSFCSYIATVVEVSVSNGKLKIENVCYAVDCGTVVNPDRVRSQMEGAAIFAASIAMYGEITAENGRVTQSNFHDYPIARIGDLPNIQVHIVPSDERPAGVGEPGVPPFAPALCNAIFNATGKRYRRLPLKQFGIV